MWAKAIDRKATGCLALLAAALKTKGALERVDLALYDVLLPFQYGEMSDEIVVVTIDDASVSELGRWPWDRTYHADLIKQLSNMGARIIGIDILILRI